MVGHNWFLPEIINADGSGIPLSAVADVTGQPILGQPLHLGQPCCALLKAADGSWKTSIDASGIFLFSIGQFPVRIDLPGGVSVAVDVALRPEGWRRGVAGDGQGDGVLEDKSIRLRCFFGSAVIGESWSEWGGPWANTSGEDLPWQGENWQLAAGWCADGTVYAHLLLHTEAAITGFPSGPTREFGIGASASILLPEALIGPGRITVTTGGPLFAWPHDQPCRWFTGHVIPLEKKIPYLPDSLSPAERLAADPSAVFGFMSHVAVGCVMHRRAPLSFVESDWNYEWSEQGTIAGHGFFFGPSLFGPRHLAAIKHYAYTDHAVVPDNGDTLCNLSPARSENETLRRINATWTVDKSLLWPHAGTPAGQFTFQANVEGHGAWGEWATKGMVATNQSASVSSDTGPGTVFIDITSFAISLSLRRHTLANYATLTGPGGAVRTAEIEVRAVVWCAGRSRLTGQGAADFDVPWQRRTVIADPIYLPQNDILALFGGGVVSLALPFSLGTFAIQGIGPP